MEAKGGKKGRKEGRRGEGKKGRREERRGERGGEKEEGRKRRGERGGCTRETPLVREWPVSPIRNMTP